MATGLETAVPEGRAGLASEWAFLGTSALLFMMSAGGMIYWWGSMSGGMSMPGGSWTRMPGQTWLSTAASFMGMWVVMMAAMMLPSLVPTLLMYRRSMRSIRRPDKTRLGGLTALAGAGYFFVWAVFGAVVYPLGVLLTAAEMQWVALARLVPTATGAVLLLAGCVQLTVWKARELGCCRGVPAWAQSLSPNARGAWQYGLRLGVHCILCCSGFMLILLVTGVMDLGIMAIVTAAITIERLAPRPERAARVGGVIVIVVGVLVIARALSI